MAKINITDNVYLILFFTVTCILSIVFLVLGLVYIMEYNLAIGLFTSFFTTSLTVIFLNFFLNYRKQQQWKKVRENALFEIAMEIAVVFSEVIELVEGPFTAMSFKNTVGNTKDSEIRKALIFSKIKEYNSTKPLKLSVNEFDSFTNNTFCTTRANLYSIHVIYGNLIDNPKIVNDIIQMRNALRLFELLHETVTSFSNIQNDNQPLMAQVKQMVPELKQFNINSLTEAALAPQTQKLVELINDLWNLEIQFDRV